MTLQNPSFGIVTDFYGSNVLCTGCDLKIRSGIPAAGTLSQFFPHPEPGPGKTFPQMPEGELTATDQRRKAIPAAKIIQHTAFIRQCGIAPGTMPELFRPGKRIFSLYDHMV